MVVKDYSSAIVCVPCSVLSFCILLNSFGSGACFRILLWNLVLFFSS